MIPRPLTEAERAECERLLALNQRAGHAICDINLKLALAAEQYWRGELKQLEEQLRELRALMKEEYFPMRQMTSDDTAQFMAWRNRMNLKRQHVRRRRERNVLALALLCGVAAGAIVVGLWLR